MKLTLIFFLLIGATFQYGQSIENTVDLAIQTPSTQTPSILSALNWRDLTNSALNKMTGGVSWINVKLNEIRDKINTPSLPEIQNGATYTETQNGATYTETQNEATYTETQNGATYTETQITKTEETVSIPEVNVNSASDEND